MEKDEKVKWMKRFEIIYDYEKQGSTIDEFLEYCRAKGYNRVAGIRTLLDNSNFQKQLSVMADKILDLNKAIVEIENLLKKPKSKKPATIGTKS